MSTDSVVLHGYWRSSCSWRVRIGLGLKGIAFEDKPVNLLKAEQKTDAFTKEMNPANLLPVLDIDGLRLTQSMSILEYLEETRPEAHPLLPKDPVERAVVRRLALTVATDIQPVQNLRVLKAVGDERKMEWGLDVITKGFVALEQMLGETAGKYAFGDSITIADIVLVPQVYNARRFKVDMDKFPIISRIEALCSEHPAFQAAHPDKAAGAVLE